MPAGRGQVGQLSIRVLPDTRKFKDDLRKALKRIERTVSATVQVGAELSRGSALKLKREIAALDAEMKVKATVDDADEALRELGKKADRARVQVPVTVGGVDRAWQTRLKRQVEDAAKAVEVTIPAGVDGERMRRDLRDRIALLEASMNVSVPADVHAAAKWRANVERMVEEIEAMRPELHVEPVANHALWRAQLALMLRDRDMWVNVRARTAGATNLLSRYSGFAPMQRMTSEFYELISEMDQAMPRLVRQVTVLGTVAAATGAALSNLLVLGADLARIGSLGLVAPAALAGIGVAAAALVWSLKDAKDYIGDVIDQYNILKSVTSEGFWSTAEAGVRAFSNAVMPLAQEHMPRLAAELGKIPGAVAAAFATPEGQNSLARFFENTRTALANMVDGFTALSSALLRLVDAGSAYLPRLGAAFTAQMEQFDAWTARITSDGSFEQWVENGITALKGLWAVLGQTIGIFGALSTAARSAGGASLNDLAAGLERVNTALRGPAWQGALTTVFKGAHDAMGNLGPAMQALGDAFINLAPTLSRIMDLATQIATVAIVGIAEALQDPVFTSGLGSMLEGALAGMQAFAPAFTEIAKHMGSILELAGVMAEAFGPLLAEALIAFAPVIPEITDAIAALVPVLTEGLLAAVQFLAPLVVAVVTAISDWVQANPELAATLLAAIVALGLLISAVVSIISFVAPIIGAIATIVGAVGMVGAAALLAAVGWALAIGLIIGALVGLVVAVIAYWDEIVAWWNSGLEQMGIDTERGWQGVLDWWNEGMGSMQQQAKDGLAAIGRWWSEGWASMGQQLSEAWESFTTSTAEGIANVVTFFAELPGRILEALGDLGGLLMEAGSSIMGGFLNGLKSKWGEVKGFVKTVAPWVADNKGPLSYDRTLLVPAGLAIMGGFNKALRKGMEAVKATVRSVAPMIQRAMSPVDLGAKVDATMSAVKARAGDIIPSPRVSDLQVETVSYIEEERRYNAELLGGVLGPSVKDAVEGLEVKVDGRDTIGALTRHRAWPKR